jgi:hypothetical protein
MKHIELAAPLGVGAVLGLSAGVVTGMMAGVAGVIVGVGVGTLAGAIAGMTMHRDEGRRAARSRELDEIIGVSGGQLGAAPVMMPPAPEESSRSTWVAEWLTPPPPIAG